MALHIGKECQHYGNCYWEGSNGHAYKSMLHRGKFCDLCEVKADRHQLSMRLFDMNLKLNILKARNGVQSFTIQEQAKEIAIWRNCHAGSGAGDTIMSMRADRNRRRKKVATLKEANTTLRYRAEAAEESWHAVRTRAAIENNEFRKDIKFGNKQIVWLNNELEETKRIKNRWKAQAKKRNNRVKVLKDELAVMSVFDKLLGFIDLSRMRF